MFSAFFEFLFSFIPTLPHKEVQALGGRILGWLYGKKRPKSANEIIRIHPKKAAVLGWVIVTLITILVILGIVFWVRMESKSGH